MIVVQLNYTVATRLSKLLQMHLSVCIYLIITT